MDYTRDIFFYSKSGYSMPFVEETQPVEVLLEFGMQNHPRTGETFFHNGWDIKAQGYILLALGSGVVTGITTDDDHLMTIITDYGSYVVTYRHVKHTLINVGAHVKAGERLGVSHRFIHFGVRDKEKDEWINPRDFLTVLYSNILVYQQGESGNKDIPVNEMHVNTKYDEHQQEIESLMGAYLPRMFGDILHGRFNVPETEAQKLKGIFTGASGHGIYNEEPRHPVNPGGIGSSGIPFIQMFQNFFIGFFLAYIAQSQGLFLQGFSEEDKKKVLNWDF